METAVKSRINFVFASLAAVTLCAGWSLPLNFNSLLKQQTVVFIYFHLTTTTTHYYYYYYYYYYNIHHV